MAWFRSKPTEPAGPDLARRLAESGCRRVAVLGLHPGAGAGTVLAALATGLARLGATPGVTSAAGGHLEDDPTAWPGERTRVPAGLIAATSRAALSEAQVRVTPLDDPAGDASVAIVRVEEDGPIVLHGPEDADRMDEVIERLCRAAPGPVCVTGRWERRAFAAPGRVDGWVLAVGSALAPTPERVAAAVGYHVEIASLARCDEHVRLASEVASSRNEIVLVGEAGAVLGTTASGSAHLASAVRSADRGRLRAIVFPTAVRDGDVQPLVRDDWRGRIVVRDATRIHVAPVWYRAWCKDGGGFEVLQQSRLLGIATNPVNPVGRDADARAFRDGIAKANPGVPVHDVVLESVGSEDRPGWRLWSR